MKYTRFQTLQVTSPYTNQWVITALFAMLNNYKTWRRSYLHNEQFYIHMLDAVRLQSTFVNIKPTTLLKKKILNPFLTLNKHNV